MLCTHLLHEASKSADSFWGPYLRVLPRTYTLLCCWPAEAAAALQLPCALAAAAGALEAARAAWKGCRPLLAQLGVAAKWLSWGAFQWAWATVHRWAGGGGEEDAGRWVGVGERNGGCLAWYGSTPPPSRGRAAGGQLGWGAAAASVRLPSLQTCPHPPHPRAAAPCTCRMTQPER